MRYGIYYTPSKEYISFYDDKNKKYILFSDNRLKTYEAMMDLLYADGGYDGDKTDFVLSSIETDTDGSEFCNNEFCFVAKSLIK